MRPFIVVNYFLTLVNQRFAHAKQLLACQMVVSIRHCTGLILYASHFEQLHRMSGHSSTRKAVILDTHRSCFCHLPTAAIYRQRVQLVDVFFLHSLVVALKQVSGTSRSRIRSKPIVVCLEWSLARLELMTRNASGILSCGVEDRSVRPTQSESLHLWNLQALASSKQLHVFTIIFVLQRKSLLYAVKLD